MTFLDGLGTLAVRPEKIIIRHDDSGKPDMRPLEEMAEKRQGSFYAYAYDGELVPLDAEPVRIEGTYNESWPFIVPQHTDEDKQEE